MTQFQARVCFLSFVFLFVGTTVNALMLQETPGQKDVAMVDRPLHTASLSKKKNVVDRATKATPSRTLAGKKFDVPRKVVREIQVQLQQLKYYPGRPDGFAGMMTRAAIMAYEHDKGLPLTAEPSQKLLQSLVFGSSSRPRKSGQPNGLRAIQLTKTVQQVLAANGFAPGVIDGMVGNSTAKAIRAFEKERRLPQSGRISGRLIKELRIYTKGDPLV